MEHSVEKLTEEYILQLVENEREGIAEAWSKKAVREFLAYDCNYAFVCLSQGEFSGHITLSVVCDEMQIANVITSERFRRKGVASALIKEAVALAKKHACRVITLEVRESNAPAACLYKKQGFEVVGKRKNFYKNPTEDAILMNYLIN